MYIRWIQEERERDIKIQDKTVLLLYKTVLSYDREGEEERIEALYPIVTLAH